MSQVLAGPIDGPHKNSHPSVKTASGIHQNVSSLSYFIFNLNTGESAPQDRAMELYVAYASGQNIDSREGHRVSDRHEICDHFWLGVYRCGHVLLDRPCHDDETSSEGIYLSI